VKKLGKINRKNWLLASASVLALVVIGLYCLIYSSSVAQAYSLATTHQPEPYTQLYFNNAANLPVYASAGKVKDVYFTIINHEGSSHSYSYFISEVYNGYDRTYQSPVFELNNGQGQKFLLTFLIPKPFMSEHIQVTLDGTNQYIDLVSGS
jgi:hypothetical protein